ncbi:MAG: S41 family peptidase [Deltaproteobacteria bacterium]|nr:S41 family peptidase [Deltaproteobacteria bacterium]
MKRVVAGILLFVALNVGAAENKEPKKADAPPPAKKDGVKDDRYENLALFQKVLYFVEQNYVEEVKNKDLIYGAIKGMMDTLDPHSNFLPPEIFKDMKTDTSGKFGGIGIEIGLKDSILTVVSPIDDTPAYKAGLKAGDKILKINGDSTKGMSLSEAVAKMRGKRGSDVLVQIWREGLEKPKDYRITRAEIKIQTTKSEVLEQGYLYMRMSNFNERSTDDMRKVMSDYEKSHGAIKGLVFDLRNNPGGLLDQAVSVSSLFIDEGVVVSTKGRNRDSDVQTAKKGMARKDFPVAVLVNGASASASEIVAGALQDHKRAVIMGQPTFGKGSVQTVIELQPEIGLKLTIARYYTPSGRSIQLKGIQPDIFLDDLDQKTLDEAMKKGSFIREKDLRHHMANEMSDDKEFHPEEYMATKDADKADDAKKKDKAKDELKPFVAKEDYQVRQALNYIKSFQIFKAAGAFEQATTANAKATAGKTVQ